MQLWEEIAAGLGALDESEPFESLRFSSQALEVDEMVDKAILEWTRVYLPVADTDRKLIIYQTMVLCMKQLRNALVGRIKPPEDK